MSPKAKKIQYKVPYLLIVEFDNGEIREFDLTPYLTYPVYERLQDEALCRRAEIQFGVITWDDETDLDPDLLYMESKSLTIV